VAAPGIFSWGGGAKVRTHGERVEREPIRGSGGRAPSGISRGRAPGGGSGGRSPLKLKALSLLGVPLMRQICIILWILQSHKTTYILWVELHTHKTPARLFFQLRGSSAAFLSSPRESRNIILFLFWIYRFWWIKIFISCENLVIPVPVQVYSVIKHQTRVGRSGRTTPLP